MPEVKHDERVTVRLTRPKVVGRLLTAPMHVGDEGVARLSYTVWKARRVCNADEAACIGFARSHIDDEPGPTTDKRQAAYDDDESAGLQRVRQFELLGAI